MEEDGYVRLFTYHWKGDGGISLLPYLKSKRAGLVSIYNVRGVPSLRFDRFLFEQHASGSITALEEALAPENLGQGNTIKDFSGPILDLVAQAYEEANAPQATEQS